MSFIAILSVLCCCFKAMSLVGIVTQQVPFFHFQHQLFNFIHSISIYNLTIASTHKYVDLARAKSEALFNIYSLLKQNIKLCNAKETVKTTRTVKNNNSRSKVAKKITLCVQHTFLYMSLLLFCTTTTWNFQKLPSYTFNGGNVVCPCSLFFHCCSCSPCWPLAFIIFSPLL